VSEQSGTPKARNLNDGIRNFARTLAYPAAGGDSDSGSWKPRHSGEVFGKAEQSVGHGVMLLAGATDVTKLQRGLQTGRDRLPGLQLSHNDTV
jgi:hypothetical protein